jgi:hypothetical protein
LQIKTGSEKVAGDWIKIKIGLETSPEVIAMSDELELSEVWIVGALVKLWCWADQHTEDGNAKGVTKMWVDRYIGIDGFANALINAGWLLVSGKSLTIPNFERHNGKPAKQRAKGNQRVKAHRERNGSSVTQATIPRNGTSVTKSFPEKKREEKKRDNKKSEDGSIDYEILFIELWDSWPEKGRSKHPLSKTEFYEQVKLHGSDVIMKAAANYVARENSQGKYCLSLFKFLADARFMDDPESYGRLRGPAQGKRTPEQEEIHWDILDLHKELRALIKNGEGKSDRAEAMKKVIEELELKLKE